VRFSDTTDQPDDDTPAAITPLARARMATELPGAEDFAAEDAAKQEALIDESLDGLERTVEWISHLLDQSAPDEALKLVVGVLVGLLHDGEVAVIEKAANALRLVANRGTHGDTIREAGGIPALIAVLRLGADTWAAEQAAGALMHLVMQRNANKEALRAAGGIAALSELLLAGPSCQAAEYAANTLGVLALTTEVPLTARAVHSAVVTTLDPEGLSEFPELRHIVHGDADANSTATDDDAPPADGPPARVDPPAGVRVRLGQLMSTLLAGVASWSETRWARRLAWPFGAMRGAENDDESYWTCPITHELFRDPVIASDGMTYEHSAIRNVLQMGNGLSPFTREPLSSTLFPNFRLRQQIAACRASGGGDQRALRGLVHRQSLTSLCLAASVGAVGALVAVLAVHSVRQAVCSPMPPFVGFASFF